MIGRARQFITAATLALGLASEASAIDVSDWNSVVAEAKGQTVYFNAWGGAENINAYIKWAGDEMKARYGVSVVHVKLDDTAKAVATVVAEKAAGKDHGGAVDLVWINGENFAAMKREGLLFSPDWATKLPNWAYVDHESKATVLTDFTIATEGLESPWGSAKLVFFYDSARTPSGELPDSAAELLEWAKANPGRFSYPQPPDFTGSSFLKQVLTELIDDKAKLQKPVDEATFAGDAAPLFAYLDKLTPLLWRKGKAYPQNYPDMKQKFADGELDIIFAFNPAEASAAIANGELPDSVRSFVFSGGTLGNTHFVAIPYNASAKAGALLFANFLLSPEAQLRKQDPKIWGDPTVLSLAKLPAAERQAFRALDLGAATLGPDQLGPALGEPHPDWMTRIEAEWTRRYGAAN
ncbi:ABC transporter substrate-binding protein [Sinorhizobium terangae]|uniref:ABC transporter substrate-binding protein n=1 Tax=Sinorhizobium terangae TaxID=110322 RepID=A0A6N7LFP1_SINTE|nr:ABC transporter substrate-binding protein [Sinorhizobium terangae]MBB4186611.1 putative thiamine transport system substrate-binding protein [Sinorhizobium terangae]MQX16617.1 ABC transporter substrate-binding protein [Sinorhizobium terangae]WFU47551.1 ABC transporter substrate-binding protein [Sinorhizobium terangae]